jgi:hypothetical protein
VPISDNFSHVWRSSCTGTEHVLGMPLKSFDELILKRLMHNYIVGGEAGLSRV